MLHSLSGVGSSRQQQAWCTDSLGRPVVSTNVEHSGMLCNEGHSHSGIEDDLIVLKTMKGKGMKIVWSQLELRNYLKVARSLKCLNLRSVLLLLKKL